MDDLAILREMESKYEDPDIKFLIKWLRLKINTKLEELFE